MRVIFAPPCRRLKISEMHALGDRSARRRRVEFRKFLDVRKQPLRQPKPAREKRAAEEKRGMKTESKKADGLFEEMHKAVQWLDMKNVKR